MNVGSLFSGIGGLDLGLHRAGWNHVFLCESDEWRRGVLRERFPGVPIYDDVRVVAREHRRPDVPINGRSVVTDVGTAKSGTLPDLLCGGFPCQDLSVAGRRAGLAGARSGLFHEFARIADALRPQYLLVENVPGLLSSNGGRDFGIVLGTLADIGYGVGWRILDSRYFGVPQRRRRVFIVGVLADGDPAGAAERAGEILAVGQGCARHSAKGEEAGSDAPVASLSGLGSGGSDDNDGQQNRLVNTFTSRDGNARGAAAAAAAGLMITHSLTNEGHDASEDGTGRGTPLVAAPLSHGSNPNSNMAGRRREDDENLVIEPQTFDWQMDGGNDKSWGGKARSWIHDKPGRARALSTTKTLALYEPQTAGVRRLIPVECERLQALPDGWTEVPKGAPDSRRYAALGDAVTASVGEWIGARLLNAGHRAEAASPDERAEASRS